MIFHETSLKGAYIIEIDKLEDERGFFARSFCNNEFGDKGLISHFVQVNNSFTKHRGTLRGMHYQLQPSAEVKLVRCINGSLYDVIIDLRPDSSTFGKWFGAELSAQNRQMMYVPKGFAHGFVTLQDSTETFYFASSFYSSELERGIRHDDPYFHIDWPVEVIESSQKDKNFPDFDPDWHGISSLTGVI
jgi:dTDP-4-dehydrorhamnose 3,5-epimerase